MQVLENYIEKKSLWHKLNPAVKLLISLFFIVIIFLPLGFFGLTISFVCLFLIWLSSRLPWKSLVSICYLWIFMFGLLFLINWLAYKSPELAVDFDKTHHLIFGSVTSFFGNGHFINFEGHNCMIGSLYGGNIDPILHLTKPDTTSLYRDYVSAKCSDGTIIYLWYTSYWYSLSTTVIFSSLNISIKIFLMIMCVKILVATTTEIQLTTGISDLLSPLKIIRVPVNEWAMTISIAIRYVPSLLDEAQNILKAQASRGIDFHNGNFKDKTKAIVSLIIPMFSIAFRKADDLSNAMEARNYSPRIVRTSYRNYNMHIVDILALLIIACVFTILIYFSAHKIIFAPYNWVDIVTIC